MRHFQSRMLKDAHDTGVIVLTLTAYNYARAFANFKYITQNISRATPAVLAYDAASKCAFDALGVAAVRVHQPKRWSRNRFFIVLKTHPALLALKAGYRVVFSEMDVFWLRDPLRRIPLYCSEPADMLVSRHRHGQVANYGFFIANSTAAVLPDSGVFTNFDRSGATPGRRCSTPLLVTDQRAQAVARTFGTVGLIAAI